MDGVAEGAREKDVVGWFAQLNRQLMDFADQCESVTKVRRRPLAQSNQPLQGSTADRKLDVGFVDDPAAAKTPNATGRTFSCLES